MGPGEYLLASLAIVTGLAVSDMISSLHGLLINRRNVRWDWLALLTAALIFIVIVGSWGTSFRAFSQRETGMPFWYFVGMLAALIPFYLAARASLPDHVAIGDKVDLAGHYAFVSRYYWAAIAIALALYLLLLLLDGGLGYLLEKHRPTIAYFLLVLPLVVWRNRRLHAILVPLLAGLYLLPALPQPFPA